MSSNETIRNPKPPSERDLQVLNWMNEGNRIDQAKALNLFKTTSLRDIIYRLRCAGYEIKHEDVSYETKDGERKSYRTWFTNDYKAIESGIKTEKALKGESIAQISRNIVKISRSVFLQPELFKNENNVSNSL